MGRDSTLPPLVLQVKTWACHLERRGKETRLCGYTSVCFLYIESFLLHVTSETEYVDDHTVISTHKRPPFREMSNSARKTRE